MPSWEHLQMKTVPGVHVMSDKSACLFACSGSLYLYRLVLPQNCLSNSGGQPGPATNASIALLLSHWVSLWIPWPFTTLMKAWFIGHYKEESIQDSYVNELEYTYISSHSVSVSVSWSDFICYLSSACSLCWSLSRCCTTQ